MPLKSPPPGRGLVQPQRLWGCPGHAHSTPGPPPAVGGRRGWGSGAACRVPGARRGPGGALWAAALPEALSSWSRPHPRKAAGSAWTPGPVQPDLRVALFCDRPRHLPLPSDLQRCAERFEISASRHRAPSICLWGGVYRRRQTQGSGLSGGGHPPQNLPRPSLRGTPRRSAFPGSPGPQSPLGTSPPQPPSPDGRAPPSGRLGNRLPAAGWG